MAATRVYFEEGRTSVFAVALEWPGWCRRAKTRDGALEELLDYRERYESIVTTGFSPGRFEVIGSVTGNATTDFGAPGVAGPWDEEPFAGPRPRASRRAAKRLLGVVRRGCGVEQRASREGSARRWSRPRRHSATRTGVRADLLQQT